MIGANAPAGSDDRIGQITTVPSAFLAEGAKCEGDRAIPQFDVARLAHDVVGIGDDEIRELAMVFFETFGALGIGLARHLRTEIGELLAELFDLGLGLEVLKGAADGHIGEADGDGAEGAGVEFWVSLHNVEGALRREGVVMVVDAGHDFAFFGVRVGGDGEAWAFDGSVNRLGSRCAREWDGRWVDEGDGGGGEFGSNRVRGDRGLDVVEGGVGLSGRGHVEVV